MKRILIILLLLCPLLAGGQLQAQLFSTSSSRHHTYTNGGAVLAPSSYEFQSTSVYTSTINRRTTYSTASMHVANGAIKTIASSVKGGVLLGDANNSGGGYIPPVQNDGPIIPGVPDTPMGGGWDVAVLLAILCAVYALYLRRRYSQQVSASQIEQK